MTISLHQLPRRPGRRHRRVGRGHGSGRGTFAGRGIKGQRARTGGRKGILRRSLGATMRKLPKRRGFQSSVPGYVAVSLSVLEQFKAGDRIMPADLTKFGFDARHARGIKILGGGKLTKKLTVLAHAFSVSARRAITDAGGSAVVLRQGARHGK